MTTLRTDERSPTASERDAPVLLWTGDRMDSETFIDLYERSPEGFRAQLIGGVVYVAHPMSTEHGGPDSDAGGWLMHYRARTPGVRQWGAVTIKLAPENWPEPDASLMILPEYGGQARIETTGPSSYVVGAPELVVEVSFTSRAIDLHDKRAAYEAAGVREYIVVLVRDREVRWFALHEGRFEAVSPDPDGLFRSAVFPGLWLDPKALIEGDAAGVLAAVGRGTETAEHAAFVARLAEARGMDR